MTRARWVATGTGGSVLLAVGALGVGALPRTGGRQLGWGVARRTGIDALRTSSAGRSMSTALAVGGIALLLVAWWQLRGAAARTQLAAAGLWALPLLLAPPVGSRDVYAYAAQGALVHAGLDPYAVGPSALPGALAASVASKYTGAPSPYGPVFSTLSGGVVALTGQHVVPAVLLLRLLAVAGLVLLAVALPRLAPRHAGTALWLGLANPLVLLHGIGGAHNEALMAGLLAVGLAVGLADGPTVGLAVGRRSDGRLVLAAVLITLAGLVKLPALAGLAVLPLRRLRPVLLVAATAAVVTVGASAGPGWGWLRTSTAGVAGPDLLSPVYGAGRALQAAGVPHGLATARATGTALGVAVAAALLLAAPRLGALRALGWSLVALAVLAPAGQPWYLLWGLPPLAAAAGPRAVRGLAAASAVLCLVVLPSGAPLLRGPTWGVPVVLAAAAGAVAARSGRSDTIPA